MYNEANSVQQLQNPPAKKPKAYPKVLSPSVWCSLNQKHHMKGVSYIVIRICMTSHEGLSVIYLLCVSFLANQAHFCAERQINMHKFAII